MVLQYENKRTDKEIYDSIPKISFSEKGVYKKNNLLIFADNLSAMKSLIEDYNLEGKIDLVYIDPPYSTNTNFTISEGRASTVSKSSNGTIAYSDELKGAAFIEFIRERLIVLKKLLSDKGSIYLHIDYKIGHYVKLIMDEVFGRENFRNDITRIKSNPKNFPRKAYGNIKDMILFYSKTDNPIWNEPKQPYTEADKLKLFPKVDNTGKRYTTIPLHAPGETKNGNTSMAFRGILPPEGRHWRTDVKILEQWDEEGLIEWSNNGNPRKKIYLEEQIGKRIQDIWELKDPQYPIYPTEKNEDLLDLIVKTSSLPNSIVLDCFCGSGTTLNSAQINGRRWIGIDSSAEALKASQAKLQNIDANLFIKDVDYCLLIDASITATKNVIQEK